MQDMDHCRHYHCNKCHKLHLMDISYGLWNGKDCICRKQHIHWKEPLETVQQIEEESPKQLLKRPTYVLNILYNHEGIYLSKRLQKDKPMYNLWQVAGGKVEKGESSLQAVLRETKERRL